MGKADTVTKKYMQKNEVFADVFNFLVYDGKMGIDPKTLRELDTTEIALPFGTEENSSEAVQKYRDILKSTVVMQNDIASYILLGIENQTEIHYAMPVKNMIYDALQYGKQVSDLAALRRKNKKFTSQAEFLSGFCKDDRLRPVVTSVVYFGTKKWDGPLSLREMMDISDEKIAQFVQDYQIHLIAPADLDEKSLNKFSTSLRVVMECIKYSTDKEQFAKLIKRNNPDMIVEREAAMVIKTITNTPISIPEEMENVDMCKALKEIIEDECKALKEIIEDEKKEVENEKNALELKNAERTIRLAEKHLNAGKTWDEITDMTEITENDYQDAKKLIVKMQ